MCPGVGFGGVSRGLSFPCRLGITRGYGPLSWVGRGYVALGMKLLLVSVSVSGSRGAGCCLPICAYGNHAHSYLDVTIPMRINHSHHAAGENCNSTESRLPEGVIDAGAERMGSGNSGTGRVEEGKVVSYREYITSVYGKRWPPKLDIAMLKKAQVCRRRRGIMRWGLQ